MKHHAIALLFCVALSCFALANCDVVYDADEFEGHVQQQQQTNDVEEKLPTPAVPVVQPVSMERGFLGIRGTPIGMVEYVFAGFVLLYAFVFLYGYSKNKTMAKQWFDSFKPLLEEQFALIGSLEKNESQPQNSDEPIPEFESSVSSSISMVPATSMDMESFSRYVVSATGRKNCHGARFSIDLCKRQDFVSLLVSLITGDTDTLTMDFVLPRVPPCVFCVVHKKHEKTFREASPDLATTAKASFAGLPENLVVLSELPEDIPHYFITKSVLPILEKFSDLIIRFHITDQKTIFTTHNNIMRVTLKLPDVSEISRLRDLILLAHYWLDLASGLEENLPSKIVNKLRNIRTEALEKQKHTEQQEAAQKRKEEKLKKEKELMENRSPEAQAKYEAKLKKREQKARSGRIMVMKG